MQLFDDIEGLRFLFLCTISMVYNKRRDWYHRNGRIEILGWVSIGFENKKSIGLTLTKFKVARKCF